MSAPTLALIMYEQAQKALEYQERQVNELRQRTGTLLGAAALTASFLGATTLKHGGAGLPVALAGLALAVIVLSGLYVLYPHELDFTPDVRRVYDRLAPARHDPDRMLLDVGTGGTLDPMSERSPSSTRAGSETDCPLPPGIIPLKPSFVGRLLRLVRPART